MKQKILITDPIDQEAVAQLESAGFAVDLQPEIHPDALMEHIHNYDGLIIRTRTKITAQLLERASKLKCIALCSVGEDHIDHKTLEEKQITLLRATPDTSLAPEEFANCVATAEHTIALILCALRRLPQAFASAKEGRWQKNQLRGTEAYQKTVGIIGLGRIGRLVATRLQGFGMHCLGYDPFVTPKQAAVFGVQHHPLDHIYTHADIITLHVPKTPETINLIDDNAFAQMKPNVMLINTARAELINRDALHKALTTQQIAGAALDVFYNETRGIDAELAAFDTIIATPHIGGSTVEGLKRLSTQASQNIITFFNKKIIKDS